jgi:hypothetical protein
VTIPLWTRPHHRATRADASVLLVAFSEAPLADGVPFSMSRYGVPTEAAASSLDTRTHARDDDPEWFDGWRTGAIASIAASQLTDGGRLGSARFCHSATARVTDPPDHGHIQAAWAAARSFVERGCFAVLDAHAGRWHDGARVAALAPDRPFDLGAEVTMVFETDRTPDFGHPIHTRGMAKFARPDLMAAAEPDTADMLAQVLHHLAQALADGETLSPGQAIDVDGRHEGSLMPYQPGVNAPEVHLNNEGYLLTLSR